MNFLDNIGTLFTSINILGIGVSLIWIVTSIFLAKVISKDNEEWLLGTITLLLFGTFLFFSEVMEKLIILVVVIVLIILGFFRRVGGKNPRAPY